MKLFVIAALIAVAAAGRLEHLERSYLPPDNNAISPARSTFGSNRGFGSSSSHGSFGSPSSSSSLGGNSGAFGTAGAGLQRQNAGVSYATSNQYLPPNQRAFNAASNSAPQFPGSVQGLGAQNFRSQQYSSRQAAPAQQYNAPSTQYGSPLGASSFNAPNYQAQFPQQSAAASRQYLAPRTSSFKNSPQQPFDEETGYQYDTPQAASSFNAPSYQAQFPQQNAAVRSFNAPNYQAQYPEQNAAASRQYLAPKSSFQNPPQQAFDEETGYQY